MYPEDATTTQRLFIVACNERLIWNAGGEEEHSDGADVCGALVNTPQAVQ